MRRKTSEALLGGVCAGIAEEYNLDVTILRILAVCGFIFFGVGPIAYVIGWVLMPPDA